MRMDVNHNKETGSTALACLPMELPSNKVYSRQRPQRTLGWEKNSPQCERTKHLKRSYET